MMDNRTRVVYTADAEEVKALEKRVADVEQELAALKRKVEGANRTYGPNSAFVFVPDNCGYLAVVK